MNGYDLFMLPFERGTVGELRKKLMSTAYGDVLEIGFGTGANLPHLRREQIRSYRVVDLEHPEHASELITEKREGNVMCLPFASDRFDTVIATLLFCSVEDPEAGLREIRRVLRPGGNYLFIEHVLPDSPMAAPLFHAATPLWKRLASGCHLNRETGELIRGNFSHVVFEKDTGVFIGGRATKRPETPADRD
jgi:ubiquinone/menaquinone biosynthesis C-methylase UbiE